MCSVDFWHNPNNAKQLYTEQLKTGQKSLRANIRAADKPYFLLYSLGHKPHKVVHGENVVRLIGPPTHRVAR